MKGLSKSRYTAFCQCPKNLWLKVYKPEEAPVDEALQALFPKAPELNYCNLDYQVQNGGDAMTIFPRIQQMPPEEAAASREALLRYCELDT